MFIAPSRVLVESGPTAGSFLGEPGLFTSDVIPAGAFVAFYTGNFFTRDEFMGLPDRPNMNQPCSWRSSAPTRDLFDTVAADNTESAAEGEVSGAYEVRIGGRLRPRPNRAHDWGWAEPGWATRMVRTGQAAISGAAQPR